MSRGVKKRSQNDIFRALTVGMPRGSVRRDGLASMLKSNPGLATAGSDAAPIAGAQAAVTAAKALRAQNNNSSTASASSSRDSMVSSRSSRKRSRAAIKGSDSESSSDSEPEMLAGFGGGLGRDGEGEKRRKRQGSLKSGSSVGGGEVDEEVATLRKRNRIFVAKPGGGCVGDIPTPLMGDFVEGHPGAALPPALLVAAAAAGWITPTPIQRQAIPALVQGSSVLGIAPTGSGKTLSFLLPLLTRVAEARKAHGGPKEGPRGLILVPTGELAAQIGREIGKLTASAAAAAVDAARAADVSVEALPKIRASVLNKGNAGTKEWNVKDVVVATPLRLTELMEEGVISLASVDMFVMDEADRLLELGFLPQVETILADVSKTAVHALMSATMLSGVEDLAQKTAPSALRVTVGTRNTAVGSVEQKLIFTGSEAGKLYTIKDLVNTGGLPPPALVFVQSKDRAMELFSELAVEPRLTGRVDVIHADRTPVQRLAAVESFRAGKTWLLISTDLMARGVDFPGCRTVVNYDCPASIVSYVHRVGRTGRAGRGGLALTLYTEEDVPILRSIATVVRGSGGDVPEWMMKIVKTRRDERKRIEKRGGVAREAILQNLTPEERMALGVSRKKAAMAKARRLEAYAERKAEKRGESVPWGKVEGRRKAVAGPEVSKVLAKMKRKREAKKQKYMARARDDN